MRSEAPHRVETSLEPTTKRFSLQLVDVFQLDVINLTIQYIWNISLSHNKVGEMFVVCGVLYAVDSVTDRNTRIRFALDLYRNTLLDVSLSFTNPFKNTTMVGYNHKSKVMCCDLAPSRGESVSKIYCCLKIFLMNLTAS